MPLSVFILKIEEKCEEGLTSIICLIFPLWKHESGEGKAVSAGLNILLFHIILNTMSFLCLS